MIVYFSGTGNSRYCAEMLADRLGDTAQDSFGMLKSKKTASLCSDRPWVFVSPTYAWRLPTVFSNFIASGSFGGSRKAYFVMTCGTDIGNAPAENRLLCDKKGFSYMGTAAIVMPENYIALFKVPSEAEAADIIAAARPSIEAAAVAVAAECELSRNSAGLIDRLKSGGVNRVFCRHVIKDKRFKTTDRCTGCGRCAAGCVQNNIAMENGRPVFKGNCIHCMACICKCPEAALEYGGASRSRRRYVCPRYGDSLK